MDLPWWEYQTRAIQYMADTKLACRLYNFEDLHKACTFLCTMYFIIYVFKFGFVVFYHFGLEGLSVIVLVAKGDHSDFLFMIRVGDSAFCFKLKITITCFNKLNVFFLPKV